MQVTSLPLSQKLQPYMKGIKRTMFFKWQRIKDLFGEWGEWELRYNYRFMHSDKYKIESVDAYTLDELLERLPEAICVDGKYHSRYMWQDCFYYLSQETFKIELIESIFTKEVSGNLTEAAGQLLLFCGEQGHLQEGKDEEK